MSHRWLSVVALVATLGLFGQPGFAADPTLQQVHQAAERGNYREAQSMMDQVLKDHPNSGKAHFVEAELLAKQGRIASAKAELDTAEQLVPGLGFAKPGAVQELKSRLAVTANAPASSLTTPAMAVRSVPAAPTVPWSLLIVGVLLAAAIVFFFRRRTPSYGAPATANAMGGYGPAAQPYGYGGVGPMGPMGQNSGGMGSGILGSLVTGAALGAGMVAGESLVHRMMDGNHASNGNYVPLEGTPDTQSYDMGGNDFGVADNSSWDDSSGGGDDWS